MIYPDRFRLTPEESRFLAKKKWDENVYCGMKMENRAVTFPQTKTILEGINVTGVRLDDIQAILNMRDAWRFMLDTPNEPVTLDYMCKLNGYIARNEALDWGHLRTGRVFLSGTDYLPPVPVWEQVEAELNSILNRDSSTTEKALTVFTWGTRGQFFWDGNKRTSLALANKLLVDGGAGMMTITEKYMEEFNTLLLEYYNSGRDDELKGFLYDKALQGIL